MKPNLVGFLILIPCVSSLFMVGTSGRYGCKHTRLQAEVTLQSELDAVDLGACHGMLHASGVRRLSDVKAVTPSMMTNMRASDKDRAQP
jgi:hypothetical protein